jgi:hypothetical protein
MTAPNGGGDVRRSSLPCNDPQHPQKCLQLSFYLFAVTRVKGEEIHSLYKHATWELKQHERERVSIVMRMREREDARGTKGPFVEDCDGGRRGE